VITLDPDTVSALRAALDEALRVARVSSVDESGRVGSRATCSRLTPKARRLGDPIRSTRDGIVRVRLLGCVQQIRLHDLRHWQATQLLDAGVPVPTVAARLGHADGTTTMKVYAHRTKRADEQAAAVVADALRRKPSA
jgi:integrase